MKTQDNSKRESLALYRRILKMDSLFASARYFSVADLTAALVEMREPKYSAVTIKRTIYTMQNDFDAPIVYDRRERGYHYTKNTYRLPAVFSSEEKFLASYLANLSAASILKGTGVLDDAKSPGAAALLAKNPFLPLSKNLLEQDAIDWIQNRIILLNGNEAKFEKSDWAAICNALKENFEITFDYKGAADEEFVTRFVRPYQLIFDAYNSNGWTLWGFDVNKGGTRLFLLSRMKSVLLRKKHFDLPKSFDYREKSNGVFGAFSSAIETEYKIRFWGEAVATVKDRVWGKNQKLSYLDDGGLELTFTGCQRHAILHWVLSFGVESQVIAPEDFVEEWQEWSGRE